MDEAMTLGELAAFRNGKGLPSKKQSDVGNIPVYGANGRFAWTDEPLTEESVVVIGRVGAYCGVVYFVDEPVWISDNAIVATPQDGVGARYLYYLLRWLAPQKLAGGSAQPLITQKALRTLTIPPPPSPKTQAEISETLGLFDDKIELNRKMNFTLEEMAHAIFRSWFVDFDPVRAKAEGREPVGMDAETAALFPDAFEDSELGEIPAGWDVSQIGTEVEAVGGGTPSTKNSKYWDGGDIDWATPKDLGDLHTPILTSTSRQITEAGLEKASSGLLPAGTVLMSSRAPIGYIALANMPVAINQGFIAMVCNGRLPNYYVMQWARHNLPTIEANAGGTTFAEISKRNFRPITVMVPPQDILQAFVAIVQPMYEKMAANLSESETLAAIRDTLLPRLMSGDLRVADTDASE